MQRAYNEHPVNPLPPVVWVLAAPIIVTEILFGLGQAGLAGADAIGWRLDMLGKLGFGKLPGDVRFRAFGRDWFLPITTTIVLSMLASLIARVI